MGILKKKESSQVGNLRFHLEKMQKKKSKLNLNKQNEKKKRVEEKQMIWIMKNNRKINKT